MAKDIVELLKKRLDAVNGKAMIVCTSRGICVELFNFSRKEGI